MRRFVSLRGMLSLAAVGVAGYALYASIGWPFRTALFPRVIAAPILILALTEWALSVWGAEKADQGHAVDFQFTDSVEPALAGKRTAAIIGWTLGFLGLIVLVGFPLAVPIFVFLYLASAREPWQLIFGLTVISWLIIEGLFDRFLHIPFPEGWMFGFWD